MRPLSRSESQTAIFPAIDDKIVNSGKLPDSRNINVYVLSSVMLVLLTLSITVNLYEGTTTLLPPLIAAAAVAVAAFLWMYLAGTHANALLLILNFSLMLVGLFLFLRKGAPDGSSLFWFIVFPPMAMVSLGLRRGSIVFCCFYVVLFLLLFTRLDAFLIHPFSRPVRIRFMLAMFGAFLFSWWVEYLRYKAHRLLLAAINALERETLTDPLTGLGNRRDFYKTLSQVMPSCRRTNEPYVLALLDIDHFKRINDIHGHQTGDQVLRHVAATILNQIRETDRMFRWGGEEFAIIMPACGPEQAFAVAERIRRKVEETPYTGADVSSPQTITISIGLYCGTETRDQDLIVRLADDNLYAAKTLGRNRVVHGSRDPLGEEPCAAAKVKTVCWRSAKDGVKHSRQLVVRNEDLTKNINS